MRGKLTLIGKHTMKKYTVQIMKFSIKDFFSKCNQIRSFLRIWSHLLKRSLIENSIFCAVIVPLANKLKYFKTWESSFQTRVGSVICYNYFYATESFGKKMKSCFLYFYLHYSFSSKSSNLLEPGFCQWLSCNKIFE